MKYKVIVLLGIFSSFLCGMEKQYELCPERKAYIAQVNENKKQDNPVDFFCDPASLKKNKIINEDIKGDTRTIINLSSYAPRDQMDHLVIMSITHKENPHEFSKAGMMAHADVVQQLSRQLHDSAVTQEFVINWGPGGGRSIAHWHSHIKNYKNPPLSLPQTLQFYKNSVIKTADDAYEVIQKQLVDTKVIYRRPHDYDNCLHCKIINKVNNDKDNLVIERFNHNILYLSHYPTLPAEVAVMPCEPVASISELSSEAFHENMILAMALMPKLQEYARNNIRACEGCNVYTKSIGVKNKQAMSNHVHTIVVPRTIITATPGTLYGNSCKLDFDPFHLIAHLKNDVVRDLWELLKA